ncbi:MAG TPA: hypothetical protein VJW76_14835, partial [Verrucomicrobiae bacterium]|nr:hypothetical protein [Verrucomicrobiae bacterium]
TVFAEFNTGLLLDTDGLYHWTNSPALADARNNVWDVATNTANANGDFVFSEVNRTNTVEAALLGGISYTNDVAGLDPRPQPGSPLLAHALPGAPVPVTYRGAFSGPTDNWADGWTALSSAGYLKPASTPQPSNLVIVTNDIGAGTTVTWNATNTYLLNTIVYVQTNATLTIEPGTVIKGGTNAANLIARPGIPNLVSALWVTRGGKLYATGTVDKPIIFTMEGDDVNDADDIPPTVTGRWGGVVMMGRAAVNSAFYITGNGASPVFDVYEGVAIDPVNGPEIEHMFGGSDDADSSGALRYVSIRHTGSQFAQDKELNSLTMGGVGSGTIIEYVESYASSDDAFEWWGGTVSARHLVAAFCEDDDFDTDQGYRGTNQFWFGIKPPWNGSADSRGLESDGDTSQTILGDRQPFSQWTVHNATLIGRGTNNVSFGGGRGWNARDEAAPNVLNTVFAEFNTGLLLDTDGLYHWTNSPALADARNNVWDVATNTANANGDFVFSEVNRTNTVEAALLGGISYTNDVAGLDPRPQPGSPLLAHVLTGAPVPVTYRGAFSGPSDNWADGWTALSSLGYLSEATQAPAIFLSAAASGGNFNLSWNSGSGPFTIQKKASLSDAEWVDVTTVANTNSAAVVIEGQSGFFRIVGQ